jgi:hypothetical protein
MWGIEKYIQNTDLRGTDPLTDLKDAEYVGSSTKLAQLWVQ